MSDQLDLLTYAPVHRTDGDESRAAAAKVDAGRQFDLVLNVLYDALEPLTDDELAERCGLLRHSAGTRRGIAVRLLLVERCGTGVTPRGNSCGKWTLTDAGRAHVDAMRRAA